MPQPTDLPIYKQCQFLLTLVTQAYRQIPKEFKPNMGKSLLDQAVQMALLVARANACAPAARALVLDKLIELAEAMKIVLRLMLDQRMLSPKLWGQSIPITESICKQAGGWKKHSARPSVANVSVA